MPGKVATPQEWREARIALLAKEKEHARVRDAITAELQSLPMVRVTKNYVFHGDSAKELSLKDLFGDKAQLIMYHYMFEPTADEGCQGCAFMAANLPNLHHLSEKNTAMVVVSRAPIDKITAFREKNHWSFPWVSSYGSDFNYDFHVTLDEKVAPVEYNFKTKAELTDPKKKEEFVSLSGEQPGLSVFKLADDGETVYHTYSSYFRLDALTGTYSFLDLTPLGRQDGPNGPAEFKLPADYGKDE